MTPVLPGFWIEKLLTYKNCERLFLRPEDVDRIFRDLAALVHPDKCDDPRAADAMARLNVFRDEALKKIADGTWGKDPPKPKVTIKTKAHVFINVEAYKPGDLFDVYRSAPYGTESGVALVKLLRDPRDEDLATAEWKNLQKLWTSTVPNAATFQRYLPRQYETATIAIGGKRRRLNAFKLYGDRFTLRDVMAKYPSGIDARDMAWMFRRLIEILSWVHDNGIVHGAILPEHVLIRTEDHSIKLVDWSYSVAPGTKIKAVVTQWKDAYPPEVRSRLPASPATDIFMAAGIAKALTAGVEIPQRISQLFDACMIHNPHRRLPSAREVYRRFDEILRDLYGPPKFRPFTM